MYINKTDADASDISSFLTTIDDSTSPIKGHLKLTNISNSNDYALFTIINNSITSGDYFKVAVAYVSGSTSFSAAESVTITFARTGDAGANGATGATGVTGQTGATGSNAVLTLVQNAQTGTTYTLVAGDLGKLVTTSNASAVTVTIPPSVFAAGNIINLQSIGVGLTSLAQGAGVTITSTGATASAPTLRARYSACTIICTASNTFTVVGDIS
jgi:hypothetical protein